MVFFSGRKSTSASETLVFFKQKSPGRCYSVFAAAQLLHGGTGFSYWEFPTLTIRVANPPGLAGSPPELALISR